MYTIRQTSGSSCGAFSLAALLDEKGISPAAALEAMGDAPGAANSNKSVWGN